MFGLSKSAPGRIVSQLRPSLALRLRSRFRRDTMLIVDGTLADTRPRPMGSQTGSQTQQHKVDLRRTTTDGPAMNLVVRRALSAAFLSPSLPPP